MIEERCNLMRLGKRLGLFWSEMLEEKWTDATSYAKVLDRSPADIMDELE